MQRLVMRALLGIALSFALLAAPALAQNNSGGGFSLGGAGGSGGGTGACTTNTAVLFNSANAIACDAGLTYLGTGQLTITNSTANTTPLTITGGSVTGSSTVVPGAKITATLNTSGVVDGAAFFANITNIASGVGTTLMDLQVGGSSKFNVDKTGMLTVANGLFGGSGSNIDNSVIGLFTTSNGGRVQWNIGATSTTIRAANSGGGNVIFGANDAALPVAQMLSVQNVVAGNANTTGANLTIQGSLSNGSGGGDILLATTLSSAASGTQNTAATALTLKGGTQQVIASGLLKSNSHLLAASTAPSISACGTGSPSVSGSDNFGSVVAGTVASSCVINFGTAWGNAPSCNAASGTAIASLTVSATTTQLTIGGTALGGDTITWVCGSTALLTPLPANDTMKDAA